MKFTKILGAAAFAAMALMAFASTASATTLEVGGVAQSGTVAIESSLKSGTSALLKDTNNLSRNTCTTSEVSGSSEAGHTTGTTVTGPISTLSFSSCTRPVTVDVKGTLHVERIGTTTNGTVSSSGAEVTVGSAIGTLNCKTGTGTDLGTLNGVSSGSATMVINATLDCGIIPSAKWEAEYSVTSPAGLGITG